MTVRVTKPEFNLREKLSELDKPTGLKGSELMKSNTSQDARDLISAGRKNIIINGSFQVAQRGTSLVRSGTANKYGTVDRFEVNWFGSGFSGNHVTESQSTDAPPGHSYSYKINTEIAQDFSSALGTWIVQKIEGSQLRSLKTQNLGYKPFTVSYWVKASKKGFTTLSVETSGGGDGSTGHSFSTAIPIHSAGVWEHKTFTFPASPPNQLTEAEFRSNDGEFSLKFGRGSNGSWLVDTDDQWNLYSSNRGLLSSKQTNFCEAVNDYIAIAGVQMEVGENATEFEHLGYGEELALCQRYCQAFGSKNAGDVGGRIAHGTWSNGTQARATIHLPVQMRIVPNIDSYTAGNVLREAINWYPPSGVGVSESTKTHFTAIFSFGSSSGASANDFATWGNGAGIVLDAEI